MNNRTDPILYIVIPCYNEQEVLPITAPMFLQKINDLAAAGKINPDSRVLFVNDGSKDRTWEIINELAASDEHYVGICQSRNRGHQNAVLAGLMEAKSRCDITISIDCDGQDDINAMDGMVDAYRDGCDIVYGVRSKRDTDTFFKLFGADGVAAYGVLMYVGFVFAAVFIGYSQGTAPIVSYHFGADNKDELKNLLRKSAGIIAVAGVAMLASSELLAGPLAKIFVGYDAGLLALTIHGMKLYSISFILSGFNIFGSAFFTALNNGAVSAAISFLRTLLFQIVSILTLPLLIGVDGIWLAVVAAEAMALVCTAGFIVWGRRKYGYM